MRSMLAFILLAFMILFGYQILYKSKLTTPAPANQVQSQTNQPIEQHGQNQLSQSPPAVGAAHESEITKRSPEPKMQFGWLTFIAKPLYLVLRFLYEHVIGNWGWAIIILTVIFNLVMFWPRITSMKSSLKMMRVQPKVDALKKRYAHLKINDPKRTEMNTKMMALYRAEGANMYSGCLPMLLPMPLLFAFVSVLRNAVELHHAQWFWLTDLSSPDPLHILPILIIVTMSLTQFITPVPSMDRTQRRMLTIVAPIIMGFSLWRYASGLSLYWATGNLINLVIQLSINRSKIGKEMHAIAAKRAIP
jgi:YidC/Oxa1 family membrane protein insertase